MRASVTAFVLLTAGCAHKPVFNSWRLTGPLLVPPGVAGADTAKRSFATNIVPGTGSCAAESPMLQLRKKRLWLAVDRAALEQQKEAGWLSNWTLQAEQHGCIAAGEGVRLGYLIVESVPLESQAAFRLLHRNDVQSGYVELGPENRLEVRSPVRGPSDAPIAQSSTTTMKNGQLTVDLKPTEALAGFEIAWYGLAANSGHPGYRFVPLSADRTTRAGVEHLAAPAVNYLQFPAQSAYYRLFYKTDDNGVTAIVISGATREDLDRRTKSAATAAACDLCVVLPKRVGVNPFLVVTVNEKELTVPLGATVRTAVQAAGQRIDGVLPTLAVWRMYAGQLRPVEFPREGSSIFDLKLNGGERLSW
jgi:hypothetical protein